MMARPNWQNPIYGPVTYSLGGLATLTNVGATYDAIGLSRGLGFCTIDFTNVAQIVFTVQCNKIGTGTQDWQLWNETDGAEVGVISDAGAAGNKTLTGTFTTNIPAGVKRVRIRCRSSVSTDDPVYYGTDLVLT